MRVLPSMRASSGGTCAGDVALDGGLEPGGRVPALCPALGASLGGGTLAADVTPYGGLETGGRVPECNPSLGASPGGL